METVIYNTADQQLHKLVSTQPKMNDAQFAAFVQDIKENGQLQPVIRYRSKIVDGRHRLLALQELGIATIKANDLPNNMQLEDVVKVVESAEKRRHQTPTQLAIKAYRLYQRKGLTITQDEAIKTVGASRTNFRYLMKIINAGRMDIVNGLEKGEEFDVSRDPTIVKLSDSLAAISGKLDWEAQQLELTKARLAVVDYTKEKVEQVDKTKADSLLVLAGEMNVATLNYMIAKLIDMKKDQ